MAQKLLLIDEDSQLLTLVGDFLSNLGYEVHRAGESDEAEALLKNYRYAIIITGTELEKLGAPDRNLAMCIAALEPRPRIIRLEETNPHPFIPVLHGDGPMVIEKPASLLRLGNLMREMIGV